MRVGALPPPEAALAPIAVAVLMPPAPPVRLTSPPVPTPPAAAVWTVAEGLLPPAPPVALRVVPPTTALDAPPLLPGVEAVTTGAPPAPTVIVTVSPGLTATT